MSIDTETKRSAAETLSPEEATLLQEEEALLEKTRAALLEAARRGSGGSSARERLLAIREEAASHLQSDDLPALLAELYTLQGEVGRRGAVALPDARAPYFAHLRLQTHGRVRDVLIGPQSFADASRGIHIIDWRNAPLARVFFHYSEGDEYEEEVDGRVLEGVVLARRVLAFEGGRLAQITTPAGTLRRGPDGRWSGAEQSDGQLEAGPGGAAGEGGLRFGTGATWQTPPPVSAMLDRVQYAALEREAQQPVLLLGAAGSGKTTVALHRLAALHRRQARPHQAHDTLVVVPEGGLARLIEALLRELELYDVPVRSFDHWIVPHARRVLTDLPERVRDDAPPAVIRFKRHPAMRAALAELVRQLEAEMVERLDRGVVANGRVKALHQQCGGASPLDRLRALRELGRKRLRKGERRDFLERVEAEEERLYQVKADRVRLLGDTALLEVAIEASDGALTPAMRREVTGRTRRQLARTTERAFADVVDAERLQTVDGRAIDEGTPEELAESIDVEDLPLLLELLRLKTGAMRTPAGSLPTWRHLVIDETQELSLLELSVLASVRQEEGSLTVAGDESQQTDPTADFISWEAVLSALRADAGHTVRLETSYRCPAAIMALSWHVLGPLATGEPPATVRTGAPVLRSVFRHEGLRAAALVGALEPLLAREPRAQVALIAATPSLAARLYEGLRNQLPVRLVTDGAFSFRPGIEVTDVAQVKGLEFDYVVVPDASREVYPDTPGSRRRLYVALTRAVHQLWVVSMGEPSPLLP